MSRFWRVAIGYALFFMLFLSLGHVVARRAFGLRAPWYFAGVLFQGAFYGLLMSASMAYQRRRVTARLPEPTLDPGEHLLRKDQSYRWTARPRFAGALCLTNRRLMLVPRRPSGLLSEISLPLDEILLVEIPGLWRPIAWLLPSGILRVHMTDGRTERFGVYDCNEWVPAIRAAMDAPRPDHQQ